MSAQDRNVVGYARVSTKDQSTLSQVDALLGVGAVKVFQEHASGATQARPRWQACLEYLQPGNALVVSDLTRLGRSTADLSSIVGTLGEMRGLGFDLLLNTSGQDSRSAPALAWLQVGRVEGMGEGLGL